MHKNTSSPADAVPRHTFLWLLVSLLLTLLPHLQRLSVWVMVVSLFCCYWRFRVYQGVWYLPVKWKKALLVIVAVAGLPAGYGRLAGLDPAIGLLALAIFLKLLEMHNRRDAFLIIFLAYFLSATEFLFEQTISITVYVFVVFTVITAALLSLNQKDLGGSVFSQLRLSGIMVLLSLPLMLVLFVFFPRVEPLWTVTLKDKKAVSGISDNMSPGDIASLVKSDELAFRVSFLGQIPPADMLYWRGLVLSDFDGLTWSSLPRQMMTGDAYWFSGAKEPAWYGDIEKRGEAIDYSIIMEPTQQNWLFTLPAMQTQEKGTVFVRDMRLASLKPVENRFRFSVRSWLNYSYETQLSPYWNHTYTRIPNDSNPRARSLSLEMRSRVNSDREFVGSVLEMFSQEMFVYTLSPPLMKKDPVDEFLLNHKKGFCEHYAGSFVFLMRAAGIPARVVAGYQGGEMNDIGNYLSVYQYDAHAWAEVWLQGSGWVRVDPTAAVAPQRIEEGVRGSIGQEELLRETDYSWLSLSNSLLLADIRLQLSAIVYYWDSWVLGYDSAFQLNLMKKFFKDMDIEWLGYFLVLFFGVTLAVMAFFFHVKRMGADYSPLEQSYMEFIGLMKKLGVDRNPGEAPLNYARRVSSEFPELSESIDRITSLFTHLAYEVRSDGKPVRRKGMMESDLKKAVSILRRKTLTARLLSK